MNDLLHSQIDAATPPVECLGLTFPSDQARREHFLNLLREKLKDPAFRTLEGFPLGTDEDILAMSDPPYYTACPNPFLEEFVRHYGKPYDSNFKYGCEPLTVDVSVGKTDPIYKAHSYHTKVPHLAIVPSILHYTEPGDVILDGFCGSGMTGVAAQWCGSAPASYRAQIEAECKAAGRPAPKWGVRRAVLNDLSPAATFIAANYSLPFDVSAFAAAGKRLLEEVATELGWMYETLHTDGKTKGRIDFAVWSEVFSCPSCAGEIVFFDEAFDPETKRVRDFFPCPHCGAELTKSKLDRAYELRFDSAIGETVKQTKRRPSLICYTAGDQRFEKRPDDNDMALLQKIAALPLPEEVPRRAFPFDDMWEAPRLKDKGISYAHQLFMPRPAQALASMWRKAQAQRDARLRNMLLFFVEQTLWTASVLNRYRPTGFSQVNQYLTGVYYVGSQHAECSPWYILDGKLKRLITTFRDIKIGAGNTAVTTGSATCLPLPADSIDYIFTDPPFGDNLPYAELNFLVESWHRNLSLAKLDAIVDRSKKNRAAQKSLDDYRQLMAACFTEYYRVLKPGRWMTVVFSNTRASVWHSLQAALKEAGFVVANVSALDKKQGSFKSVTTSVAVKQDHVISAYKPNGGLEDRLAEVGGSEDSAWDFVRTHLKYLPNAKVKNGELGFIAERDPRIIFDRMVAWFVRHEFPVPLSSQEFQAGLSQRFAERDGMAFLPEQVSEYDKKRMQIAHAPQMEMFIADERSAIDWLSDFLKKKPSTYQEVHPEFIRQLGAGWKKHETNPELSHLLETNFLCYDPKAKDGAEIPSQVHSYLSTNWPELRNLEKSDPRLKAKATDRWYVPDPNKARDLEMVRDRALLKEFETYRTFPGRRLKTFRLEAMRTGFKTAWATVSGLNFSWPGQSCP